MFLLILDNRKRDPLYNKAWYLKLMSHFLFYRRMSSLKLFHGGERLKLIPRWSSFWKKNFLKVNEKQARCHFVNFEEVLPHTTINSKHIRYFKIFRESLAFKVWKQRIVFCVLYTLLSHPQCRTLSSFPFKIENMVVITNRSRYLFKNGPSKIWGRKLLKTTAFDIPYSYNFLKGCLPQIVLSPFLNTLSYASG